MSQRECLPDIRSQQAGYSKQLCHPKFRLSPGVPRKKELYFVLIKKQSWGRGAHNASVMKDDTTHPNWPKLPKFQHCGVDFDDDVM